MIGYIIIGIVGLIALIVDYLFNIRERSRK